MTIAMIRAGLPGEYVRWDDPWLNESFASWLGDRITAELQPGWGFDSAAVAARREAMRTDRRTYSGGSQAGTAIERGSCVKLESAA